MNIVGLTGRLVKDVDIRQYGKRDRKGVVQKKWTPEETKQLISLYKTNLSNTGISKKLNRTFASVSHKLYTLGLSRPHCNQTLFTDYKNPMQGKKQTEHTKSIIRAKAIERFKNKYNHPSWKGGRIKLHGYICVRLLDHPRSRGGYVFEHDLIMESILNRHLIKTEVVHHINGIRDDNRPENLMLFQSNRDHQQWHKFFRRNELMRDESSISNG